MRFSIVVPVYEVVGGASLLFRNLKSINEQSFKDLEVVVPDNSENNNLKKVCSLFSDLRINHFFNPHKGMAQNTNAGINASQGELIKFLYMDDYLAHQNALTMLDVGFQKKDKWLASACNHHNGDKVGNRHYPSYNNLIHKGVNTIGSPSVVTILNKDPLLFDENMTWLLDCDYYKRLYDLYGGPALTMDINVTIGTGEHQMTYKLSQEDKKKEEDYIVTKYK